MDPSPSAVTDADGVEPWVYVGHEDFRGASRECHEYQQSGLRYGGWRPEAAGVEGVGESMYHTLTGGDFVLIVSPDPNNPRYNPPLDKCPPVCLRRMRSSRANRSGRPLGSEWKEFDKLKPLRATTGRIKCYLVACRT
ncbi:hypothetical protein FPOAC1_002661 [Fusarium poae]|uniref:hypothetical protein n=1 Tax=Fusarium poae TaxID=36050 RepID=UPI001CEBBB10|nr:hypothetical protein FPOAC1_002661 [Fusarium poae]KAG8676654.1 hypothetical protein FPOAC1_002661 [Fusarium poae]